MKVLCTGADGFIASHLKLDATVLALNKDAGDITDKKKLMYVANNFNPDIILHLAANTSSKYAEEHPTDDFEINAQGTLNVLEVARANNAKVIYPSTHKTDKDESGARSPYGLSKWVGQELCEEWALSYGVPIIVNRISNLYGLGGDKFWVNYFIKTASEGNPITLFGDGGKRDMLWVEDLAVLLNDQVNNFDKYEGINEVGAGKENSISPKELLDLLDYKNIIHQKPLKGDKSVLISSYDKVSKINDWKPMMGIKDGIERLIEHYDYNNSNV